MVFKTPAGCQHLSPWVPVVWTSPQLVGKNSRLFFEEHASILSHVWFFATPWTVAHQAPLSIGFFRQEYYSGLPFPSRGDLPNPGIESASPAPPALAGGFFTTEPLGKTNQYSSLTIRNLFLSLPLVEDFACLEGAGIRKNLICKEKALGLFFFFIYFY